MKRCLPVMLLLICIACCVLAACGTPEITTYRVTFFDGDKLLMDVRVEDGGFLERVPDGVFLWQDSDGNFVDPLGEPVTERLRFFAWAPALREDKTELLATDGRLFRPEEALTRGEAAALVGALAAEDAAKGLSGAAFSDVSAKDGNYKAIQAATAIGIMRGYSDGTFRPEAPLSRAEFAQILYRLAGEPEPNEGNGFTDVSPEHWASAAIRFAADVGWFRGYPDGTFRPEAPLSRAEAAVIAVRFRGARYDVDTIDLACAYDMPFVDVIPGSWAYYDIIDTAYTNDLLACMNGYDADVAPGVQFLNGQLCHVNRSLALDHYEPGFQTIDGKLYYIEDNGWFIRRFSEGLIEFDGSLFDVTKDDGPFLTDANDGYLYFGEDGRYTSGDPVVDECVEELLRDILDDDEMTQDEKLYAGYLAVRDGGFYYRPVTLAWVRGSTDWSLYCARVMYTEKMGSCFYWASAFLYVARRLGYQAYPVCGGVGTLNQLHAWVMLVIDEEEFICDVELEWAYRLGFYSGIHQPNANLYMQPVNRTYMLYIFPGQVYSGVAEESDEEVLDVPEPTESPEPSVSPEASATPRPSATPRTTATPRPTATARVTTTPRSTATPAATARVTATPRPTTQPTAAPTPTLRPIEPTATPTVTATPEPTQQPTPTPENDPTSTPEDDPTPTPEDDPTPPPEDDPTPPPEDDPTPPPEDDPTPPPEDDPTSPPEDEGGEGE